MSYETMMYIGIGVSVVMFVLSIILFVQLNIPKVIGGITGYTAQKEIKEIRKNNIQTGKKGYRTSQVNRERGKITISLKEKIKTNKLKKESEELTRVINETKYLETTLLNETTVLDKMTNYSMLFEMEVDEVIIHSNERI